MTIRTEDVLKKALKKISKPTHWIKGLSATDADGLATSVKSKDADCFCSLGAIWHVTADVIIQDRVEAVLGDVVGGCVASFNDHPDTTHADVMAAFKKAIHAARTRRMQMERKRASK